MYNLNCILNSAVHFLAEICFSIIINFVEDKKYHTRFVQKTKNNKKGFINAYKLYLMKVCF